MKPFFISRFSSYIATEAQLRPKFDPSFLLSFSNFRVRNTAPPAMVMAIARRQRLESDLAFLCSLPQMHPCCPRNSKKTHKGNRWKPLVMLCSEKGRITSNVSKEQGS